MSRGELIVLVGLRVIVAVEDRVVHQVEVVVLLPPWVRCRGDIGEMQARCRGDAGEM